MMNPRELLLSLTILVAGCGQTPRTCAEACAGCCDASGVCQPGRDDTACGSAGFECSACGPGRACSLGVCVPAATGGGPGGGGGGGVAGGGAGGGAGLAACAGSLSRCDGQCVDLLSDPNDCGVCNRGCTGGQVCLGGSCELLPADCTAAGARCPFGSFCDPAAKTCQPGCRLNSDCPTGASCDAVAATCGCPADQHACGQRCVSDTALNSCGTSCQLPDACPSGAVCAPALSTCACPTGQHACAAQCVPDDAVTSCGSACTSCPQVAHGTPTCAAGACGVDCAAGYRRSGQACVDVDECATGNGGCSPNAICTNTDGSFTCGCKPGFTGDGASCTDVNECLSANGGCSADATCTNTPGSRTCTCKPGYTGNGVTCADVNECLTANGGCSSHASCTNTPGSRTCACQAGYVGDGVTCTDVNECLTANGGCSAHAICTNTQGGRTCACNAGYTGDGVSCTGTGENCLGPIDVTAGMPGSASLATAVNDFGPSLPAVCGGYAIASSDRVFRFVPATTGNYRVGWTVSPFMVPTVWRAQTCGVPAACGFAIRAASPSQFVFHGAAGQAEFLHVEADPNNTVLPDVTVSVTPVAAPANDLCANAAPLVPGVTVSANVSAAAPDSATTCSTIPPIFGDVVFAFTPPTTKTWLFTTSSGNARVFIRADCSASAACEVVTPQSSTTFSADLTAGVSYFVFAHDYTNSDFTFTVQ